MPRSPGPILQEPRPRLPATGAAMPTTRKDNSFTSWNKIPRDFPRAPKNTKFSGWRNCFFLCCLCFPFLHILAQKTARDPNHKKKQFIEQKTLPFRAENFAFQSRKLARKKQFFAQKTLAFFVLRRLAGQRHGANLRCSLPGEARYLLPGGCSQPPALGSAKWIGTQRASQAASQAPDQLASQPASCTATQLPLQPAIGSISCQACNRVLFF